jgi:hypothetical protein
MYIEEQIERFLREEDFWRRRILRESFKVLAKGYQRCEGEEFRILILGLAFWILRCVCKLASD